MKKIFFSKKCNNDIQPLIFSNKHISCVSSIRHIGLQILYNLYWREQVDIVCLKTSRKLSLLQCVKNLQRSTLDLFYKTTIRSVIDYGLIVYYHSLAQIDQKKSIKYSILQLNL